MLNSNKVILGLAMMFSVAAAQALPRSIGTEGGGGENAVVCFKDGSVPTLIRDSSSPRFGQILDSEIQNQLTSVESYDLYEARIPRGLGARVPSIVALRQGESAREYAERIARRFDAYIPVVGKIIRSGTSMLPDARILMRPSGLNRIHDENDVGYIEASRCVVATMAAQYKAGENTQLQLDARLFSHALHSPLSQAVLFLHEAIYYSARTYAQHEDSRATRTLVSALINEDTTSAEIMHLLKEMKMPFSDPPQNYFSELAGKIIAGSVQSKLQRLQMEIWEAETLRIEKRFDLWANKYSIPYSEYGGKAWVGNKLESYLENSDWRKINTDAVEASCKKAGKSCQSEFFSLYADAVAMADKMKGVAVRYLLQVAAEKIFPEIDTAPQFDEATKNKAKDIIRVAIQKGEVSELRPMYDRLGYSFSKDYPLYEGLRSFVFPIPKN